LAKPKLGIFNLTGCGGDQLMILNMESELIDIFRHFSIEEFQEGSSYHGEKNLDVTFVEGSVSTKRDLKRLKEIRKRSKFLIALGDCAIGGCVQAMRNGQVSLADNMKKVYGKEKTYYEVLEPKGLSEYVLVDLKIPGCPIEKEEVTNAITSILHGDYPEVINYPVCVECKLNGYLCVLVEKDLPCLGPVTTAGCDARCPNLNLDCIGCRGPIPKETKAAAELDVLLEKKFNEQLIVNRLRFFGGNFKDIKKLSKRTKTQRKRRRELNEEDY
jgi:sulfhydrogenase subunit delta